MSYLLLSKYPPLCIRTIYGCIISSQNYKLQITLRSWGYVCQQLRNISLLLYIIYIIYNNKNIYIINYYFIHYKTIIFHLFGTIRKV